MGLPKKLNSKARCLWCGKQGAYHNSKYMNYFCSIVPEDCPSYKALVEHQSSCKICNEDGNPKFKTQIKCYEARYILDQLRDKPMNKVSLIKMKIKIQKGLAQCAFCSEQAHYLVARETPCCSREAYDCPAYSGHISKLFKLKYKERPELRIQMAEVMKEVQNRPDVKEAKSAAMIELHNGDCDKCKRFQGNYKRSQRKRRTDNYWENRYYNKGRNAA